MDEDDLNWVANEQNLLLLFKKFHENLRKKPPGNLVILQRCEMML